MESFESYRPYLFSIAYRMLGSAMDAEDLVQETYLRSQSTPPETIRSLKAFLTTILTRLCMDQLQLARRKREVYVGPWLPEPILTTMTAETLDPAERVEMNESISLAFLVLLEQLQPFERAVFLLREAFEYEFAEIATMLDQNEATCRRSFSRAKLHLRARRPRFPASRQIHRQLLDGYVQAVQGGDMTTLTNLLSEEVTLWADGGGKIKQAPLRPIIGRDAVPHEGHKAVGDTVRRVSVISSATSTSSTSIVGRSGKMIIGFRLFLNNKAKVKKCSTYYCITSLISKVA